MTFAPEIDARIRGCLDEVRRNIADLDAVLSEMDPPIRRDQSRKPNRLQTRNRSSCSHCGGIRAAPDRRDPQQPPARVSATNAFHPRGGGSLFWFVDDVWLASRGDGGASWPLARGRHTIVCCDADGRAVQASVAVE